VDFIMAEGNDENLSVGKKAITLVTFGMGWEPVQPLKERTGFPTARYTFSIRRCTGVPWRTTSRTGENSASSLIFSGEASDLTLKVARMC